MIVNPDQAAKYCPVMLVYRPVNKEVNDPNKEVNAFENWPVNPKMDVPV